MPIEAPQPLPLPNAPATVKPEWIDPNGHMNVAYYNLAFDQAADEFFDVLGLGWNYTRTQGHSLFILETHIVFLRELMEGDPLRFSLQLLDMDARRIHYFLRLFRADGDYLAATSEQITTHVNMETRQTVEMPAKVRSRAAEILQTHRILVKPEQAGQVIGIRRKMRTD